MKKIYSNKYPDKLLHILYKNEDYDNLESERDEIIPSDQFIQLCSLKMKKGKTFRPHQHIWKKPQYEKVIAQESWVVITGSVKCILYDIDEEIIHEEVLSPGEVSITLEGGHTYEILEDNTRVYEYKTATYHGQKLDKVFIGD